MKSIRIRPLFVVVPLFLLLAGITGWWQLASASIGWVELTNAGPPLLMQVLGETSDEPASKTITVTARSTLSLPAGDYRLRVHGVGRLGRTFRFAVNSGETQTYALSLNEGRLLGGEPVQQFGGDQNPGESPIPFAPFTAALELTRGKFELIEWTGHSVIRRDAPSGTPVWDTERPAVPWKADERGSSILSRWFERGLVPQFVRSAPDVDGDGIGDVVCFSPQIPALLAISGLNGAVLWEHPFALDAQEATRLDDPKIPGPLRADFRTATLVDAPAVADLDQDEAPDLIATLVFSELPAETETRSPSSTGIPARAARNQQVHARRAIQAISGRTGQVLWDFPIESKFMPASFPAWNRPARIVPGPKPAMIAYVDGDRWVGLDAATGKPRGAPVNLGFEPVRPVQYAELDGDGKPDILALGPGQAADQLTLTAFSLDIGQNLWREPVNLKHEYPLNQWQPPSWPIVVDLDGDGRAELAVPDSGPLARADGYRGVRLIDGQTGQTRWVRPLRPENKGQDGLLQILEAPDLDRDGVRDLVTSSFFLGRYLTTTHNGTPPVPERIYVDALSGKDGHPLWWWHRDNGTDRSVVLAGLRWWGRGPDGWPLLAVPIGQTAADVPPIVENLEASTGRVFSSAVGMNRIGVADLDGDGLDDLWGEAGGHLYAFRGETPELWRALGWYGTASYINRWTDGAARSAADFDGDGIGDTLIPYLTAPIRASLDSIASHAMGPNFDQGFRPRGGEVSPQPGGRTAIARSGRDGHLIWKTELDRRRLWYERDHGEHYNFTPLSLPNGDLDGDETPDVLVQKQVAQPGSPDIPPLATLPLEALSGRTGNLIWAVGPLPLGFEAYGYSYLQWFDAQTVEPRGGPDIFVRHSNPFGPRPPSNSTAQGPNLSAGNVAKPRLARISGRNGRVLWDIGLSADQDRINPGGPPGHEFGDLDRDGSLDVVMVVHGLPGTNRPNHELQAVSLRDGRRIWSARLDYNNPNAMNPQLAVGDLDGDDQPEIVVTEHPADGDKTAFAVTALNGRDGSARWTWNGGKADAPNQQVWGFLSLANFGPDTRSSVCLNFTDSKQRQQIIVLDEFGHERSRRELPADANALHNVGDVNGDGRDEVIVRAGDRLQVWTADLQDLWTVDRPSRGNWREQIIPGQTKRPAMVIFPPSIGLNGADGQARWSGMVPQNLLTSIFTTSLLDLGDAARPPSFLTTGLGSTVCRAVVPTTPTGVFAPPQGAPVPPGLDRGDPRWTRPLPWTIGPAHDAVGSPLFGAAGLALFNVFLPLLILRLVALRRPWTMRLLMMLPIAAAVPLTAFSVVEPLIPVLPPPYPASTKTVFFVGSLIGVPIVIYVATVVWLIVRRRWRRLSLLIATTVVAAAAIGIIWIWLDVRSMPAIDRYSYAGWYLVLIAGSYLVGAAVALTAAIPRRLKAQLFRLNGR